MSETARKPFTLEDARLAFIHLDYRICGLFPDTECPRCIAIEVIQKRKAIQDIPKTLLNERGVPGVGVSYKWLRQREGVEVGYFRETVGERLSKPESQSGTWYIDGGWGGPPGPVRLDWDESGKKWANRGFPPWES